MKPALLLIDLQNDYLATPGLQPPASDIVRHAGSLLADCRSQRIPIFHVQTSVTRQPDNRMPHWKSQNRWMCEKNTPGQNPPLLLEPHPGETTIEKQFFSAFSNPALQQSLQQCGFDTVIFAGIHLHACIRATVLDAYALGYNVIVADDAVGSDDPLHAAITRRYLHDRGIRFYSEFTLRAIINRSSTFSDAPPPFVHHNPANHDELLWEFHPDSPATIARRAAEAKSLWLNRPPTTIYARAAILRTLANLLELNETALANRICADVGKPISLAHAEVRRSAALLRATADQASLPLEFATSPHATCRRQPLGLVAVITPWNNPLAIAVGKIAPALLFDNAVIWKPAPAGTQVARDLWHHCRTAGVSALHLVCGDSSAAAALANDSHIDAVTLTGSNLAGHSLHEIAVRRYIPFQAELGGNNAAILADDYTDVEGAASQIAAGAFGFAGQRCTANRRVIVPRKKLDGYMDAFIMALHEIRWGDPRDEHTLAGPVISKSKCSQLRALLDEVRGQTPAVRLIERLHPTPPAQADLGNYAPLSLVLCDVPNHPVVQEEYFGPILVVQPADHFDHAIELANDVRQGLVAALYSRDAARQQEFLQRTQAGILKLNQSTCDADALSPFGGLKTSSIGPPEHGASDREFFTRTQTIYRA